MLDADKYLATMDFTHFCKMKRKSDVLGDIKKIQSSRRNTSGNKKMCALLIAKQRKPIDRV